MLKRTVSGIIAVAVLLMIVWADVATSLPFINGALLILTLMALYEMYKPFGFIKRFALALIGFAMGTLIFINTYFEFLNIASIIVFFIIVMFILAVTYHKTVSFSDISLLLFATLYISLGMLHIRLLVDSENGFALLFTALISAFLTDTGAYFVGCAVGKHKLIPEISPKKTVEGSVGGTAVAILSLIVFSWILTYFGIKTNILNIVIIGFVTSVGSQFGDLSASMIKRELKIKDYGDIMPGHGGVLDRFDSLLFAAPIVYYLNIILPLFTN